MDAWALVRDRRYMAAAATSMSAANASSRTCGSTARFSSEPPIEAGMPRAPKMSAARQSTRPSRAWLMAATMAVTPTMTSDAVVAACGSRYSA